ncbi:NADP-dependent 3-hydroxy acid dehydrogenase YdfG [Meinhardsimonia xiamenensis]|jgi:NAD(P)-dependent dehydrogenase (short-subunit alcohol dehydrogenase family)|uniref:NADP-dependent 3-hydroxy acid dehydrogenase YdfG n=1 Tax=Meinhardsimonia xiamenensis TaxID=990712 RepID=A0A1G9E6S1_9RHOB|nr:SDR family oxidoreductase [Meinhardsimonia xiamenensis]PRX33903.1 NADP-dependent 3-hydroxy acid dehydrogenase YdfG [Meinhardsimonia xiamenensis]SDK71852.1 NADP-dependent 3-hydroxy acid dehydrogenase YdfG [Meinhardsimonia xiamenensis]
MRLAGKTVLVTGASRGIGRAAAEAFHAEGANVVLVARSENAIAELSGKLGERSLAVPCDVSRLWEVQAAVDAAVKEFGGLDVLVNNAGVIEPIGHLGEVDPEAWSHSLDINLKGVFHGIRAALPVMLAAGGGTVLNVSSGAAHRPLEGWSQYCAAKAGAAMLTRSLDLEYRARGIRAMGLSPGTVATDMQRAIRESGINPVSRLDWSEHIPPEWPARALVWMATPEADAHLGEELSLRDPALRARLGLGDKG